MSATANPTPARPRLAPNVIAMHAEQRPPVQQSGRRGRYPRNVAKLADRPRLMPGDIAEFIIDPWRGVRVMILRQSSDPDLNCADQFAVLVLGDPVEVRGKACETCIAAARVLRLVRCGYMSEWRRVEVELERRDVSRVHRNHEERIGHLMEIAVRNMVRNLPNLGGC